MLQPQDASDQHAPATTAAAGREAALPLDLVELELALDGLDPGESDFAEILRVAAKRLNGEFLFELPASDLADNCTRIAALRVPDPQAEDARVVLALLDAEGRTIRVEYPDERTEGLKRFAQAFIGLLERL